MLRTFSLAVVLAASTFFVSTTLTFAADLPSYPTTEQLVAKVLKVANKRNWQVTVDQVKSTIERGVNFGMNGIIIPRGCDATDCQQSIVIDITTSKIIDLPGASYDYLFEKGNVALIVNSDADEYFRVSDSANTGKYPDWLSRKVYIFRKGCLILAAEDKTGHDMLASTEMLAEYRSYESSDADFIPLAKPICK